MDNSAADLDVNEPEMQTPAAAAGAEPQKGPATAKSLTQGDAIYRLESPARCPQCGERLSELKAIRLLRVEVNFTSMLPRRGRIVVCPYCQTIVPAELTNF
jgi:hypothetical protein